MLEGGFLKGAPLNLVAVSQGSMLIFHENEIKRYNLQTQVFKEIIEIPDSLKNIVVIGSEEFAIEDPADSTIFGVVITSKVTDEFITHKIFRIDTAQRIMYEYYSDLQNEDEPVQFEYFSTGKHFLTKGEPGKANSKILIPTNPGYSYTTVLGEAANFMIDSSSKSYAPICVVMYGDHRVHIVNSLFGDILKTILTHTTGANGPRECAIDGDNLYVTTYNCDIRKFSISTGELLKIIPVSGKADPIQVVNGKLIVGITRTCDSLPNNTIAVIDPTTSIGNEEPFAIAASVSPNPFKNSAVISATFPAHVHSATIEIFNSNGVSLGVFKTDVLNGELNFPLHSDVLKLAQGQYMARISAGKQVSVVPFVIVK